MSRTVCGIRFVAEAKEFGGRLGVEGVDVVLGAFLDDVHQPPVAGRNLPGDDVLEGEVRREIDDLPALAEGEGGDGSGALEVDVAAVASRETGEPGTANREIEAFEVALGEIGPLADDAEVGSAARPVHLVVDPGRQPEAFALLDGEFDPVEVVGADVLELQTEAAVEDDAGHPFGAELLELIAHLRRGRARR